MASFSPPKGIHCFSTRGSLPSGRRGLPVSVPRRGFIVFLLSQRPCEPSLTTSFSPPKGIQVFVTWKGLSKSLWTGEFQSPEGDSGLCYLLEEDRRHSSGSTFQSPEGDSGLCYAKKHRALVRGAEVSVPRRGFRSLLLDLTGLERGIDEWFQSPEGDSGLCYSPIRVKFMLRLTSFSPPKGIQVFVTLIYSFVPRV